MAELLILANDFFSNLYNVIILFIIIFYLMEMHLRRLSATIAEGICNVINEIVEKMCSIGSKMEGVNTIKGVDIALSLAVLAALTFEFALLDMYFSYKLTELTYNIPSTNYKIHISPVAAAVVLSATIWLVSQAKNAVTKIKKYILYTGIFILYIVIGITIYDRIGIIIDNRNWTDEIKTLTKITFIVFVITSSFLSSYNFSKVSKIFELLLSLIITLFAIILFGIRNIIAAVHTNAFMVTEMINKRIDIIVDSVRKLFNFNVDSGNKFLVWLKGVIDALIAIITPSELDDIQGKDLESKEEKLTVYSRFKMSL